LIDLLIDQLINRFMIIVTICITGWRSI